MPCWPKNQNVKEFQFCAKNPLTMHKTSNLAWDFCDGGFISLAVETAKICLQKFRWRSEKNPRKTNISLKRKGLYSNHYFWREHDSFRGEVRFSKNQSDSARILWQLWRSPRWFDDNPVDTETVLVSKVFRSLLKGDYTRFNSTISFFQTKTIFKRSSTKLSKKIHAILFFLAVDLFLPFEPFLFLTKFSNGLCPSVSPFPPFPPTPRRG